MIYHFKCHIDKFTKVILTCMRSTKVILTGMRSTKVILTCMRSAGDFPEILHPLFHPKIPTPNRIFSKHHASNQQKYPCMVLLPILNQNRSYSFGSRQAQIFFRFLQRVWRQPFRFDFHCTNEPTNQFATSTICLILACLTFKCLILDLFKCLTFVQLIRVLNLCV